MKDRVALIKRLKAKYEGRNCYITTIEKVAKQYNLNEREVKYIFFDKDTDIFIKEVVILGL